MSTWSGLAVSHQACPSAPVQVLRHDGRMRFIGGSDDHEHPSVAEIEAWTRRRSAPENEVPAGLEFSALLGRSDESAVFVSSFRVYSTGLGFTLSVRLRREPRHDLAHRIHELISGHGPGGREGDLEERLLLGVEYADSRTATNLTSPWPPRLQESEADPLEPLLERERRRRWWAHLRPGLLAVPVATGRAADLCLPLVGL